MNARLTRRYRGLRLGLAALVPLSVGSCAQLVRVRPLAPSPPTPVIITPVDVTTTYIAAYGHHYVRGEFAIVEVCVAADGTISATRIVTSSTDRNFDESALNWARQVHYHPQLENGKPVYGCQQVRVEINLRHDNGIGRRSDSALG